MKQLRVFIFAAILLWIPALSFAGMIGPYSGQVVDSRTGEPVEGASVLFYWVKVIPYPMGTDHETIDARLIYTDKDGKYNIPIFWANLGLTSFFESTNVVIYEPGYEAYIKRVDYSNPFNSPDTRPDPSFKEKNHIVKLDRIPPNFSHKKHYENIEHALWGIDDEPHVYTPEQPLSWEKKVEILLSVKGINGKEEFLRRVEWENRRGQIEWQEGQK
mgnify:CR=1 FL=1